MPPVPAFDSYDIPRLEMPPDIPVVSSLADLVDFMRPQIQEKLVSDGHNRMMIVVDGPPGAGKTTLLRHLSSEFGSTSQYGFLPFHMDWGLGTERGTPQRDELLRDAASFQRLYCRDDLVQGWLRDAIQAPPGYPMVLNQVYHRDPDPENAFPGGQFRDGQVLVAPDHSKRLVVFDGTGSGRIADRLNGITPQRLNIYIHADPKALLDAIARRHEEDDPDPDSRRVRFTKARKDLAYSLRLRCADSLQTLTPGNSIIFNNTDHLPKPRIHF